MTLNFHAFSHLSAILLIFCFASSTQGKPAQKLLKFNNESETYELNRTVLEELSRLQRPIRVIAVLGDARIGKSTTLNMCSHIWGEAKRNYVEEIFETGDTLKSVTHDVWAHVIYPQDDRGSAVLLDVAGTNLGNDKLTDHLSMFTALISSGINVFVRDAFQNSNLHFLYRLSRLSNIVFPNITLENFPKLRVVIRGDLQAPDGTTIEDHIQRSVAEPSFEETKREERKSISKYFPKNEIAVTEIPIVSRKLFKDFDKLRKSNYWMDINHLVAKFKEVPIKKTLEGSPIDGPALVDLAVKLTETMNANSWPAFGDVYDAVEKNICKRSYVKVIEPLFAASKADEIEDKMKDALRNFSMECVLESETTAARNDLRRIVKQMREVEELERKAKEAEKERIEAEKKREMERKKFEKELSLKDDEIANVRKASEDAVKEVQYLKKMYEEQVRALEILKQQLSKRSGGWWDVLVPVGIGVTLGLLSDRNLKQNITLVPLSPYSMIGLNGACWEWNEIANKELGLAGKGCGVIAQDVKELYPCAITEGRDGYLRVRYDMLNEMINNLHYKAFQLRM